MNRHRRTTRHGHPQRQPVKGLTYEDLLHYLQSATIDNAGAIPAFVEITSHPGNAVYLQLILDEHPEGLETFLPTIARLMPSEKAALKAEIRAAFMVSSEPGREWSILSRTRTLEAIDAIPETPTLEEYPRFSDEAKAWFTRTVLPKAEGEA